MLLRTGFEKFPVPSSVGRMLTNLIILTFSLDAMTAQPVSEIVKFIISYRSGSEVIYDDTLKYETISKKPFTIRLNGIHFIDHVKLTTTGENSGATITLLSQDANKEHETVCPESSNSKYDCKGLTHEIEVKNLISDLSKLELFGYDVNFYKYVGCFADDLFVSLERSDDFHGCETTCQTPFYGFDPEEKCLCIISLNSSSVLLALCDTNCKSKNFVFCGGSNHISVYSKRKVQDITHPRVYDLSACTTYPAQCPVCDAGRTSKYCEFINCSAVNGSCEGIGYRCEVLPLNNDFEIGVCLCRNGYFSDENGSCFDIDECNNTLNPCDDTRCYNTDGSFTCDCRPGFMKLDDKNCGDYNECINKTICDIETALCKNLYGSFECACRKGFARKGNDLRSCIVRTHLDKYSEAVFDMMLLLIAFVLAMMSILFISTYAIISRRA